MLMFYFNKASFLISMDEKICRLCLQTISSNNCQAITESLVKTLKLNRKICKENVMCIECASWLRVFSKFTSSRVYVGDGTLPSSHLQNDFKLEPVETKATSNLQSLIKTEIKCSFCTETQDLVPLKESKKLTFMVNTLEQYILETDLKNTEELLTCGTCLEALQGVSSFILKRSEVEEKISKYIELEGTDEKGQIELKNVQQFTFKPILKLEIESFGVNELEVRCDPILEEYITMAKCEIKREQDENNTELIIKTEDGIKLDESHWDIIDIKSERSDCDRFHEPFIENKIPNDPLHKSVVISDTRKCKDLIKQPLLTNKISSETEMFYCEICSYKTKHKADWKRHLLGHKSPSEIEMFKCELCSYEAKYKYALTHHLLSHNSLSGIETFKCELCSYEAKYKAALKRHLLIHDSSPKLFKCDLCSYRTKHNSDLKRHLLIHKSFSDTKVFKCALCIYETKYKSSLERHLLTHKRPSEIEMFKCELCPYEAKQKRSLKNHLLNHNSPSEVKMIKCESCSFETKHKSDFTRHLLTHKGPSQMFRCELCSYETTHKGHHKKHLLTHKRPSEIKMFKCGLCSHETKRKRYLIIHLLTHKNPSELKMFKCELCSYEAKRKCHLRDHLITHKSSSDVKMFKCTLCSHETKHKSALKTHLLTHKNPSDLKMFKCELCTYESVRKATVRRHLLTHR